MSCRFSAVLFVLALSVSLSGVQAESLPLDAAIPGHPGKTWLDVARAVVPDLQPDGSGATAVPLPYVVDRGNPEDFAVPELAFDLDSVDVQSIGSEGRQLTLVSLDLGPADGWAIDIEALALFDERLQLLDVINVGQDRFNEIRGTSLRISATDEAVLTYSEHFNSNQSYGSYALIMVRDGKFQVIDTVGTLSDRWCGHDRTQTFTVESTEMGGGFWPLTMTVTDTQKVTTEDADCGDEAAQPGFETTYAVTYRWSASMGLYVADGDGFAELATINEARY